MGWLLFYAFADVPFQVGEVEIDYLNCSLKPMYDLNYSQNTTLVQFVFWMFGIAVKLIPSLLLTFFVVGLIRSTVNIHCNFIRDSIVTNGIR